mmetsp:Transcript_87024/g.244022  ORF Transcript_87024/g.244022 Transcript_87024/m.244022 type:complete len:619 (+) Transcript_87024:57-1913(+)
MLWRPGADGRPAPALAAFGPARARDPTGGLRRVPSAGVRSLGRLVRALILPGAGFCRRLWRLPGMDLRHLRRIGLLQEAAISIRVGSAACSASPPTASAAAPVTREAAEPGVQPKGTPLDAEATRLSVLSYNLLAPLFVRPIDKRKGTVQPYAAFEWAEPAAEVLDWDARRPRLLAELCAAKADVICLQEVQFEPCADGGFGLPSWLKLEGYAAQLPGQSYLEQMAERNLRVLDNKVAIGCAVLYRKDRLEAVGDQHSSVPNRLVSVCLQGRRGTALAALEPTVFFSVHLDAQAEDQRVDQLSKCLSMVRQMGCREVVMAGDMNTEVFDGSCVSAFVRLAEGEPAADSLAKECASALRLGAAGDGEENEEEQEGRSAEAMPKDTPAQGPTEGQLQEWRALWQRAAATAKAHRIALSRVSTGATRAAYDHGCSCGPCVTWRLDHIFYTSRTLELCSRWSTLEADPEGAAAGLPNRTSPSDHYPVAATFIPSPAPRLSAEAEALLAARLKALEERHADEGSALQREFDAREPAPAPAAPAPNEAEQGQGKKKNKKNERPSPEMIAFIQEKRRRAREQKEAHAKERAAFVEALDELELDALERCIPSLSAWIESGTKPGAP